MKLIKLGLISIVVFSVLITLMGLLFPSHVLVSRVTDIDRPAGVVNKLVLDIRQWNNWMEAAVAKQDSLRFKTSGEASYGNMQIRLLKVTDTTIVTEWKGNSGAQLSTMRIIAFDSNKTTVQWQFEQDLKWYPWERFGSMFNDRIIGTLLEKNLESLKKIALSRAN